MKTAVLLSALTLGSLASAWGVKSLSEYTKDLPDCANAAMKAGMHDNSCNVSTVDASDFDCLCDNYYDISGTVFDKVSHSCAADFTKGAAEVCGVWADEGSKAKDLAAATQALAGKLGATANEVSGITAASTALVPNSAVATPTAVGANASASPEKQSAQTPAAASSGSSNGGACQSLYSMMLILLVHTGFMM